MSKTIEVGNWPVVPSHPSWLVGQADNVAKVKAALAAALEEATDHDWMLQSPDEFSAVVAYLGAPTSQRKAFGPHLQCHKCSAKHQAGHLYKGPFRYPFDYLHYIFDHGIKPPQQLISLALIDWVDPENDGSIKVGFWPDTCSLVDLACVDPVRRH